MRFTSTSSKMVRVNGVTRRFNARGQLALEGRDAEALMQKIEAGVVPDIQAEAVSIDPETEDVTVDFKAMAKTELLQFALENFEEDLPNRMTKEEILAKIDELLRARKGEAD